MLLCREIVVPLQCEQERKYHNPPLRGNKQRWGAT